MARDNPKPSTPLAIAADLAARVVERRSTIPILSHLALVADGKILTVTASDLDTEVTAFCKYASEPFEATASAEAFGAAIAHLGGIAVLKKQDGCVVFGRNKTEFRLTSLNAGEYPRMKAFKPQCVFELSATTLADDLRTTLKSSSTEETRFYLNGVVMHAAGGKLIFAATDGHRLHVVRRDAPNLGALENNIIRRKAVSLIVAAIDAQPDSGPVSVEVDGTKARFTIGKIAIATKLIDGQFPDYSRVIPTQSSGSLIVSAAALRNIARGANLMGERKNVVLALDFAKKQIRTHSADRGDMVAPLPGQTKGALPPAIGVNPRYLEEICSARPDGTLTIEFTDAASPIRFEGPDGFEAVLMPMRLL